MSTGDVTVPTSAMKAVGVITALGLLGRSVWFRWRMDTNDVPMYDNVSTNTDDINDPDEALSVLYFDGELLETIESEDVTYALFFTIQSDEIIELKENSTNIQGNIIQIMNQIASDCQAINQQHTITTLNNGMRFKYLYYMFNHLYKGSIMVNDEVLFSCIAIHANIDKQIQSIFQRYLNEFQFSLYMRQSLVMCNNIDFLYVV